MSKFEMVQAFIKEDLLSLLDVLRESQGFPGVCYTTSQIVSSYFKSKSQLEPSIVCGTFGENHLFHTWLLIDGAILDFTLFQFHQDRLTKKAYAKMPVEQLMEHIQRCQKEFVLTKDHPMSEYYHPLVEMKPEYMDYWRTGMTFQDFLHEVLQTNEYHYSDWLRAKTITGQIFGDWLLANNKRVTKRFFTKYAIVDSLHE